MHIANSSFSNDCRNKYVALKSWTKRNKKALQHVDDMCKTLYPAIKAECKYAYLVSDPNDAQMQGEISRLYNDAYHLIRMHNLKYKIGLDVIALKRGDVQLMTLRTSMSLLFTNKRFLSVFNDDLRASMDFLVNFQVPRLTNET